MDVGEVFSSKVRMKVLKLLCRFGQLTATDIGRRLTLYYSFASKNLKLLENETLVEHTLCGRVKYFRLPKTAKAQATMKLLEEWEKR